MHAGIYYKFFYEPNYEKNFLLFKIIEKCFVYLCQKWRNSDIKIKCFIELYDIYHQRGKWVN